MPKNAWRIHRSNGLWEIRNQQGQIVCIVGTDTSIPKEEHAQNARYFVFAQRAMTVLQELSDAAVLRTRDSTVAYKNAVIRRAQRLLESFTRA
jgi:hypothetical protein